MPRRPTFTAPEIARLRLQALGLVGRTSPFDGPAGVAAHHLAMQAQDFRASRWAIGSRLAESTDAEVRAAYERGALVRSWPMRGTVHVTQARDLPWMLALMGERALVGVARRREHLGIDEAFLERARDVAVARLRGGGRCTRAELAEACTQAGLDVSGQRLYHTVWYLSQTRTLVQGPVRDQDHQLVLFDEWIRDAPDLSRPEALRELAVRYLRGHAPAALPDLEHWTKLTRRDCRAAFAAARDAVVEVDGPGGTYWMLTEQLDTFDPGSPEADAAVLALAAFDEHLLGYRVRDAVLDPAFANRIAPGRNGVFRWTVVAGARVVATWGRVRRTHDTLAEVAPFHPLDPATRAAATAAIARWGHFADTPVEVRWVDH